MEATEKQDIQKKIDSYNGKIKTNNERISALRSRINKLEYNYESLRQFKEIIQSSSNSFNELTQSNKKYLNPVVKYSCNNNCAKEYAKGMSGTLSGFGTKIVGAAFGGFLLKIRLQLESYRNQINGYSDSIETLDGNNSRYYIEISRLENELMKGDDRK